MADPISGGGIGKASQQMMQELQRQAQELAQKQGPDRPQFQDAMAKQVQGVQDPHHVAETQKVNEATKAVDVLKTAQAQSVQGADQARLGVKPVEEASEAKNAGMKKLLDTLVDGQNKLDSIIQMAVSGKQYSHQDLLAIQAAVYKFSQELELTSKVVEKATSGVKQTMQTQV